MDKNISFMGVSFLESKSKYNSFKMQTAYEQTGPGRGLGNKPFKPNVYETENLDKSRCGSPGGSFALVALLGYPGR